MTSFELKRVLSFVSLLLVSLVPHVSFAVVYEDGQVFVLEVLVPSLILLLVFKVVCLCIKKFLT